MPLTDLEERQATRIVHLLAKVGELEAKNYDLTLERDGACLNYDKLLAEAAERVGAAEAKVQELEAAGNAFADGTISAGKLAEVLNVKDKHAFKSGHERESGIKVRPDWTDVKYEIAATYRCGVCGDVLPVGPNGHHHRTTATVEVEAEQRSWKRPTPP